MKITADEAKRHGLPAATIELDPGTFPFLELRFPGPTTYLVLAGPPGGPLGLSLEAYSGVALEADALEKLVPVRFARWGCETGTSGKLVLGGKERAAVTCAVGRAPPARAHHLVTLVPESPGRGVLVDAYVGGGLAQAPPPEAFLAMPDWGDLLRSIRVTF
jgi:hypothetical protein